MRTRKLLLTLSLFIAATYASAQQAFDVNLWNGRAPHDTGVAADTAKVRVFLPAAKRATGRAVVICPGGGYDHLAWRNEGTDWAPFFNDMGIAAIVLKYRMPHGVKEAPLSDAEQAMRLVRKNAQAWHVNRDDIGIMGFSAGGHLASTVATESRGDAKANFQILFYPVITMMPGYTHKGSHDNLLGKKPGKSTEREYSTDMQVSRATPRAFILLSDDDTVVPPANGVSYYLELYRHDVPASLHVYPSGNHGFGFNSSFRYHVEMRLELQAWLRSF
jgi:hypothetical protein